MMKIMYIDLNRCYKWNHSNFFVVETCIDLVYFRVKCNEKSNSVAFQANIIYENYNVWQLQCNNLTHDNCINLPHSVIFYYKYLCIKNPCTQGGTNPTNIYTTCTHFFPNCVNFQLYLDFFLAQGDFSKNEKNLLGEVKIIFFAITFSYCRLSSPNFQILFIPI